MVAVTRQLYNLPVVRPVTVIGERAELTDPVAPPLLDVHVAVYDVIALPPVAPALNVTTAEPGVCVTVVIDGALGAAATTNNAEAAEAGLWPKLLVASTVHEYVLPLDSDATVIGEDAPVAVWPAPPLLDVHVAV